MFFDTLEQNTARLDKKIKEICIQTEKLETDIKNYFNENNINPIEVALYLENKENFSDDEWEFIQETRKKLDEKLNLNLSNIKDPVKAKKSYNDRLVQPNWLFVR